MHRPTLAAALPSLAWPDLKYQTIALKAQKMIVICWGGKVPYPEKYVKQVFFCMLLMVSERARTGLSKPNHLSGSPEEAKLRVPDRGLWGLQMLHPQPTGARGDGLKASHTWQRPQACARTTHTTAPPRPTDACAQPGSDDTSPRVGDGAFATAVSEAARGATAAGQAWPVQGGLGDRDRDRARGGGGDRRTARARRPAP